MQVKGRTIEHTDRRHAVHQAWMKHKDSLVRQFRREPTMLGPALRRFYPLILGIGVAAATWFALRRAPEIPESVFSPVVSSLSILVSFLGADDPKDNF